MKYLCLECDTEFNEEDGVYTQREPHPELDGCPVEVIGELRCPYCGADWESLKEI